MTVHAYTARYSAELLIHIRSITMKQIKNAMPMSSIMNPCPRSGGSPVGDSASAGANIPKIPAQDIPTPNTSETMI